MCVLFKRWLSFNSVPFRLFLSSFFFCNIYMRAFIFKNCPFSISLCKFIAKKNDVFYAFIFICLRLLVVLILLFFALHANLLLAQLVLQHRPHHRYTLGRSRCFFSFVFIVKDNFRLSGIIKKVQRARNIKKPHETNKNKKRVRERRLELKITFPWI